jgi:hypothetical protein
MTIAVSRCRGSTARPVGDLIAGSSGSDPVPDVAAVENPAVGNQAAENQAAENRGV